MDLAALNQLVEDKQAPGSLVAVQAFMNTCDYEYGEELLSSPKATREWLVSTELAASGVKVGSRAFEQLHGFRRTLRSLVEAHSTGDNPSAAIGELGTLAVHHPVRLAADGSGTVGLDLDPVGSTDELVSQFLGLVFEAQRAGQWARLKTCSAGAGIEPPTEISGPGECRWIFYDASKNRGGHWCRMDMCGNRAKNRTYRERGGSRSAKTQG